MIADDAETTCVRRRREFCSRSMGKKFASSNRAGRNRVAWVPGGGRLVKASPVDENSTVPSKNFQHCL